VHAVVRNGDVTSLPGRDQRRTSKKATIEALVRRSEGAAITELIAATGWQQHSVRAALTGLRKAGHVIARERCDDSATRYRIAEVV
jgi:DNA-binding transcriptional regulator PaaX